MSNVFGVELEYEGVTVGHAQRLFRNDKTRRLWTVHADGSLRPRDVSCELVFDGPKTEKLTEEAIQILDDVVSRINDEFDEPPPRPLYEGDSAPPYFHTNWRTAMHVHVDARSEARQFLPPMLALCTLVDPMIFSWDGHHRYESKYCTPLARVLLAHRERVRRSISASGTTPVVAALTGNRYLSVNFSSLSRHGSIEFRQPQSTTDSNSIREFVKICGGMFDAARKWSLNHTALLKEIDKSATLQELAQRVLPDDVAKILVRNVGDEAVDLPSVLIAHSMLRSD